MTDHIYALERRRIGTRTWEVEYVDKHHKNAWWLFITKDYDDVQEFEYRLTTWSRTRKRKKGKKS